MKKMLLLSIVAATCSLQAAFIDYRDLAGIPNGAVGNFLTRTDGLFSVKATAWSAGTAGSGPFAQARLRDYGTAGLGVCTAAEYSAASTAGTACDPSATNPSEHQVDNLGEYEFVMFQFSSTTAAQLPVTNIQVLIGSLASDWDVSYWVGNTTGAFNLNGMTTAQLLTAGFQARVDVANENLPVSGGLTSVNVGNSVLAFNTIIFGPRVEGAGNGEDGFKIKQINWTVPGGTGTGETVPEPSTYAMLGAGLLGLGYWRRKSA